MSSLAHFLNHNSVLYPGDSLYSEDGTIELRFQISDGNLILLDDTTGEVRWHADLSDKGAEELWLQGDGNLVVYNKTGKVLWESGTTVEDAQLIVRGGTHRDFVIVEAVTDTLEFQAPRPPVVVVTPPKRRGLLGLLRRLFGLNSTPVAQPTPPPVVVPVPTPPVEDEEEEGEFASVSTEEMSSLIKGGHYGMPWRSRGREWVELIVRHLGDPTWGWNLRPNGKISTDILAKDDSPYRIYDVIRAEETDAEPAFMEVEAESGAKFAQILMMPTRHLPRIVPEGMKFVRETDGKTFVWAGATAFDLPVRLREGNDAYLRWLSFEKFTLARIVCFSKYRTMRSMEDGLRDLAYTLKKLEEERMYAEVVVGVDTREYGLSADEFLNYCHSVGKILSTFSNTFGEVANENTHSVQAQFLSSPSFLRECCNALSIPCVSAGSTHGGETPQWDQGTYATHHADRNKTPESNGEIMGDWARAVSMPLVDDEALGIKDSDQSNRTRDPDFGVRQARAMKAHGLAGVTLHLDAGLNASMSFIDNIQREAARRFIAEMKR